MNKMLDVSLELAADWGILLFKFWTLALAWGVVAAIAVLPVVGLSAAVFFGSRLAVRRLKACWPAALERAFAETPDGGGVLKPKE